MVQVLLDHLKFILCPHRLALADPLQKALNRGIHAPAAQPDETQGNRDDGQEYNQHHPRQLCGLRRHQVEIRYQHVDPPVVI
ncbi:hypothetical protein D3C81_2038970 [compost metagenome]